MVKIRNSLPEIDPDGWYNASQSMRLLEMSRTSFYQFVKDGKIKRRMRKMDHKYWYKGKDLLSFWNSFL